MGVYLSEPNKDKHISSGSSDKINFVSAEMQGKPDCTQAGEKAWKTQPSILSTLGTATASSLSLMATVVHPYSFRIRSQSLRRLNLYQIANECSVL